MAKKIAGIFLMTGLLFFFAAALMAFLTLVWPAMTNLGPVALGAVLIGFLLWAVGFMMGGRNR